MGRTVGIGSKLVIGEFNRISQISVSGVGLKEVRLDFDLRLDIFVITGACLSSKYKRLDCNQEKAKGFWRVTGYLWGRFQIVKKKPVLVEWNR